MKEITLYENFFRHYIKNSQGAILVIDIDSKKIECNNKFLKLLESTEEEAKSKQGEDILKALKSKVINPETIVGDTRKILADRVTERTDVLEFMDGGIYQVHTYPIVTEDNNYTTRVWSLYDITDQIGYQRKLELLHEGAYRLSMSQTKKEIVDIVLEVAKKILRYEWGGIGEVKDEYIEFLGTLTPTQTNGISFTQRSVVVRAVKEKKSQLIGDTRKESDYFDLDGKEQLLSELAVPVILNGEVINILDFESRELNKFTEQDRTLLELLAMHIASSFNDIKHHNEIIKIYEEHNRELIKNFERISSMIRHDLQNPLTTINQAFEFIKKEPEVTQEMYGIIERNIKMARDVMEDWKQQILDDAITKDQTNINKLINDVIDAAFIPSNIEVSIDADESMSFELDRRKFVRIIGNLFKNSVEAMTDGGKISIKATANGRLVITISDTGKGMSKDVLNKIFTPFFTTKETGMGLGLAFCKQAVEAHGGEIHAESTTGQGATISVSIPKQVSRNTFASKQ